jgi:hypothetical protein
MNQRQPKLDLERYFLVSQEQIYKIDCMVGALNLAITEILERRPVKYDVWQATPAQNKFDRQVGDIIYGDDPHDDF